MEQNNACSLPIIRGITFGVFDLFHIGHLNFFIKARRCCDELCVGVCDDFLVNRQKKRLPVNDNETRVAFISNLKPVSSAFLYYAPDYITDIERMGAKVLIVGEDFGEQGVKQHKEALDYCRHSSIEVQRITRTPNISSTMLRSKQ